MAPSSGHLLVPKVLKVVRFAIAKTNELVRSKFPTTNATAKTATQTVPVYARNHPIHPLAYLKQARAQNNHSFSSQARTFSSATTKPQRANAKFSASSIGKTIQRRGVSPFTSTLRPNLTGGTLPRTAGGYSLGGAGRARYFSHTSGCQAQVVNNVSAGIRAFFVGGGKMRYDGVDPLTGEKRYRAVTATQDKAYKSFDRSNASVRGTSIEFKISPTVTALLPTFLQEGHESTTTLQTPELLSTLSGDFARSLNSLSQILGDLNRLSALGELPILLKQMPEGPVIAVRFPGCDADLVARLCDEVGVTRGIVREDSAWQDDKEVQMALLFPFAPAKSSESTNSDMNASDYFFRNNLVEAEVRQEQLDWRDALSESDRSIQSKHGDDFGFEVATLPSRGPHPGSLSGYESLGDLDGWTPSPRSAFKSHSIAPSGSQDYEGVEGIYRFLQVCDESRR